MTSRENETVKRRSLLSFASEPEPAAETQASPDPVEVSGRDEDGLDHYHRMRALRLAANADSTQFPLDEDVVPRSEEEAQQAAVDRMRADMAAIKAE
ncbi:MAG: hypothetical protein ACRECY_18230, partial [Phyllobacterium sp.]